MKKTKELRSEISRAIRNNAPIDTIMHFVKESLKEVSDEVISSADKRDAGYSRLLNNTMSIKKQITDL